MDSDWRKKLAKKNIFWKTVIYGFLTINHQNVSKCASGWNKMSNQNSDWGKNDTPFYWLRIWDNVKDQDLTTWQNITLNTTCRNGETKYISGMWKCISIM